MYFCNSCELQFFNLCITILCQYLPFGGLCFSSVFIYISLARPRVKGRERDKTKKPSTSLVVW